MPRIHCGAVCPIPLRVVSEVDRSLPTVNVRWPRVAWRLGQRCGVSRMGGCGWRPGSGAAALGSRSHRRSLTGRTVWFTVGAGTCPAIRGGGPEHFRAHCVVTSGGHVIDRVNTVPRTYGSDAASPIRKERLSLWPVTRPPLLLARPVHRRDHTVRSGRASSTRRRRAVRTVLSRARRSSPTGRPGVARRRPALPVGCHRPRSSRRLDVTGCSSSVSRAGSPCCSWVA